MSGMSPAVWGRSQDRIRPEHQDRAAAPIAGGSPLPLITPPRRLLEIANGVGRLGDRLPHDYEECRRRGQSTGTTAGSSMEVVLAIFLKGRPGDHRRLHLHLRPGLPTPVGTTAPRHSREGRGHRHPTLSATPKLFPRVHHETGEYPCDYQNGTNPRPLNTMHEPPRPSSGSGRRVKTLTTHHAQLSTGCPPKTSRT